MRNERLSNPRQASFINCSEISACIIFFITLMLWLQWIRIMVLHLSNSIGKFKWYLLRSLSASWALFEITLSFWPLIIWDWVCFRFSYLFTRFARVIPVSDNILVLTQKDLNISSHTVSTSSSTLCLIMIDHMIPTLHTTLSRRRTIYIIILESSIETRSVWEEVLIK